jgi:TRAP-type C4-dicarboxylate transport system permease small subunit
MGKFFIQAVDGFGYLLLVVATLVMVTSILLQVFFRYVMNSPLYWSEEVARYAFVWLVFIGAAIASKRGTHIGVDYIVMHLPELPKNFLAIFVNLLVLSFIAYVIYMSAGVIKSNMTQLSPAMRIPMGYIFMAIPTGFSISFVYITISLSAIVKHTCRSKYS